MFLVLPFYGPSVVYNVRQLATMNHADETPHNPWNDDKRPLAVLARLFYVARIVVAPLVLAPHCDLLSALFGVPLVAGAVLTFLFVVSHNFEGSERSPAATDDPVSVADLCTSGSERWKGVADLCIWKREMEGCCHLEARDGSRDVVMCWTSGMW